MHHWSLARSTSPLFCSGTHRQFVVIVVHLQTSSQDAAFRPASSLSYRWVSGVRCFLRLAAWLHRYIFFWGGAWPLTLSCCSNYDPGWRPPLLFCSTTRYTPGFNYHCVVDPSQSLGDQSPPRVSKNKKNLCRT